jgi:hypothetical protein
MRVGLHDLGAPARLAVFALALALVGGVAALAGSAIGHAGPEAQARSDADGMGMELQTGAEARSRANGLATEAAGYTFVPERTTLPLAQQRVFRFRILDARGEAVRRLDLDGGVRLHLIVVRRDFAGYQHLHPVLARDGSWSTPLTLSAPGVYRAFADFDVAGKKTVLGHDLFVPGNFVPASVAAPATSARSDGFRIALTHGELHAGKEMELRFSVTRNGGPAPSFDSYVGHRGHLVALRDGDLAYSHVHPLADGAPGEIVFHTELATAGRYRLFLQFKIDGVVHTAPFTVEVAR